MVKNTLRQPTQMVRADASSKRPSASSTEQIAQPRRLAKVVPLVGLRITEPKRTLSQIYERGLFRYTEGRFDEACLDFKQASRDLQNQASCILMASRCYQRSGKTEKALALLKTAVGRKGCPADEIILFQQELALLLPEGVQSLADRSPGISPVEEVPPIRVAPEPVAKGQSAQVPVVDLYAAPTSKLVTILFGLSIMALLGAGYWVRGEQFLTAESGLGYQFGIVGSLLMLMLMLYPLRKKTRLMRNWGAIPLWFRFHMLAGIIGPVLILFHANFQLGSLNSRVVLGSTLLVAGSGVFGRYLYTKIHYGLYGKRVSLEQLHDAISCNQNNLAAVFLYAPKIKQRLLGFDDAVLRPSTGVFDSILRVFAIDLRRRWTHLRIQLVLRRALKVATRRNHWTRKEKSRQYRAANKLISRHLSAVLKVAEFSFYERFFSLWHIFHMPLFLLLVVALVMHVIAVHMY